MQAQAQVPSLPEVHRRLAGLEGDAFRARARALFVEHPEPTIRAVLLRGGSQDPPGLTGARAERRVARRLEALDWIRAELAADPVLRSRWFESMYALMGDEGADPELLGAALRVVGELGRYELARDVAWELGSDSERVREAARAALYRLYGRRFPDWAAFEEAWPRLLGREADALFLADLVALQERNDTLELALVEKDPARAAELFRSSPPPMRARVAGLVGRAVGQLTMNPDAAIALLLGRVASETDVIAFHAALEALLQLVGGLGHDAPGVVSLRAQLTRPEVLARTHLADSIVQALANLPWNPAAGDDDFRTAIRLCSARLGELADAQRPVDYDRLHVAIDAFRVLSDRSGLSAREVRAEAQDARAVVELLTRPGVPDGVRLDVAVVFPLVSELEPLPGLLDVLSETASTSLQFTLLGTLAKLVDPRASQAEDERLLDVLRGFQTSLDVDLRGRALDVLDTDALQEILWRCEAAAALRTELLAGLSMEEIPSVRAKRMAVLRRLPPDGTLADELLARPDLDALLDGNHRRPEQMVETIWHHARNDVPRIARAARELASDGRESPPANAMSRSQRCLMALGLLHRLDDQALARLEPADHAAVIAWARSVRGEAGDAPGEPAVLRPHLARIVAVHLPAAPPVADAPQRAPHLEALFRGDLHVANPSPEEERAVLDAYRKALEAAQSGGLAPILRDRARFLWSVGKTDQALTDYRSLVFPQGATEPRLGGGLLDAADLSRLLRGMQAGGPEAARRGVLLGLGLLAHPGWYGLGTGVRQESAAVLLDRALACGDPALQARVLAPFQQLPETFDPEGEGAYPGEVFDRLFASPDSHAAVLERVTRLRAMLAPPPAEGGDDGDGDGG